MNTLHYFHVHNGKGASSHADGETYEVVFVCDEHRAEVEADEDSEYITTWEEDTGPEVCDKCPKEGK